MVISFAFTLGLDISWEKQEQPEVESHFSNSFTTTTVAVTISGVKEYTCCMYLWFCCLFNYQINNWFTYL